MLVHKVEIFMAPMGGEREAEELLDCTIRILTQDFGIRET